MAAKKKSTPKREKQTKDLFASDAPADAEPIAPAEPAPEAAPEAAAEAEAAPTAEPKPEITPATKAGKKKAAKKKAPAESAAKPAAKSKAKSKAKTKPAPAPGSEPESPAESMAEPAPKAQPESAVTESAVPPATPAPPTDAATEPTDDAGPVTVAPIANPGDLSMKTVGNHLRLLAVMLELTDDNSFRSKSYDSAARNLEALTGSLGDNLASGKLADTKGIGKSIVEKLHELANTGKIKLEDDLRAQIPVGLFEIMDVQGLGPKRIKTLWHELNITTLAGLEAACQAGNLEKLDGFGKKTQANILANIEFMRTAHSRFHQHVALHVAEKINHVLAGMPAVKRFQMAGSLRRCRETVGDLDFVCAVDEADAPAVAKAFTTMPGVIRVLGEGPTKCSIIVDIGIQVDLRLVREHQFAFALAHFTGSKEHNILMRQRAIARGLKLNEYGLTRADGTGISCATEAEIYAALDVPAFIAPEMREDMGEIDAAVNGRLPELVSESDLRGIFHMHTTASDGKLTLEEVAEICIARGYEYIGITDHSPAAFYANGLSADRLLEQIEQIAALNAKLAGKIKIFAGTESDILTDGSLDFADEVLAKLDFVIASIHSGFSRDEKKMTERVIRAIEHPATRILGHPTGRLLLQRDGYPLDIEKVLAACARTGTAIEINANPHRLDLDWRWVKRAREMGVQISIGPDAHARDGFDDTRFGVGIARKGWLTKADVINTRPLAAMAAWLAADKATAKSLTAG